MIRIIADDKIPFLKGVLEPFAEIIYLPVKDITREITLNADALLIRTRTKCDVSLLKDTPVKFIGTATIGFDHIDTEYCENHDIKWTNAPGCNSSSVRQYIAAALFKIVSESRFSLKGKTIGIVGVGNVGSKIEKFARAMGMDVLLNDPPRARKEGEKDFVCLEEILHESDIVTLHVPLNKSGEDRSWHLFDEKQFRMMKKGAWFINSARGEVVKTSALKEALGMGRLSGAVLDVWEHEPAIDIGLMSETFIATPHIAGYSTDGKANGTSMVINSLSRYFKLPLNNWYPADIPKPEKPLILIDCPGKTEEDIISEAVAHTYCIDEDDLNLRHNPSDFEKLRGNYGIRREFPAFTVRLKGGSNETRRMLNESGFNVEISGDRQQAED